MKYKLTKKPNVKVSADRNVRQKAQECLNRNGTGMIVVPTVTGKGKVVPGLPLTEHQARKAHWRSGGTVPPVL
jgi:hypothetical protein